MKVSTAGIVHETTLISGPIELVRPRPVAAGAGRRLHHGDRAAHQVRRHDLRADRPARCRRPPPNLRGVFRWRARDRHLGDARGAAAGRVRGLHQARRPGARSSSAPPSMRSACSPSSSCGPTPRSIPTPCGRRSSGAARPTRRCPPMAPLDFRPGAIGCEGCGLVCVPAEHDGRCPRCGSARARAQARQPQPHLGLRDRRRHPLHPGQLLSGAHRDPARRRRSPAPSWAASRNCWPRRCIRWRCWCSSPASWCRCSS